MILVLQILSFFLIIPAVLAGIFFKQHRSLRYFSFYLFLSVIFEGLFFLTALKIGNNWWLLDIFSVVEFCFLGAWLTSYSQLKRKWLWLAVMAGILIAFAVFKPQGSLINIRIQHFLLFIGSGIFLIALMQEHTGHHILEDARLWLASGLFMRFATLCLVFTLTSFLENANAKTDARYFAILLSSINLLAYTLYCKAYLCKYPG